MPNYIESILEGAGIRRAPEAGADGDRPFRHYSTQHRIVSWVSRNLFDEATYTVQHGLLRGMKRKGGLGWAPAALAPAETAEEEFWRERSLAGLVAYDVGSFHGLMTMFFSTRCRRVISYEPSARNRRRLEENVALNGLGNVTIRPVALGAERARTTMFMALATPGGATIDHQSAAALRRQGQSVEREDIAVTTLDLDIREFGLPEPGLIKIDVEGAELETLAGARETLLRSHPELFIEIHGETMNWKQRNAAAVVEYLESLGYNDLRHVESRARIDSTCVNKAARGHLSCRFVEAAERNFTLA